MNPNRQKAAAAAAVEVRKGKDVSKGIGQKLLLLGTTDISSIHSICSRAAYSCCNACYVISLKSIVIVDWKEMRAVMLAYLLLLMCR